MLQILSHHVSEMLAKGKDLTELEGIGDDLAEKIETLVNRGGPLLMLEAVKHRVPAHLATSWAFPNWAPNASAPCMMPWVSPASMICARPCRRKDAGGFRLWQQDRGTFYSSAGQAQPAGPVAPCWPRRKTWPGLWSTTWPRRLA